MKKIYLSLLMGLISIMIQAQNTYTVNAGGGADFTTISAAVNAAVNGDIILVSGTISGDGAAPDGILVNKDVIISGQGASSTIVEASTAESDGGINRRVFTIVAGATVTLKDMTIRHGYINTGVNYDGGGGIKNSGTLIVENCLITKNHVHTQTYQFGGGILTDGAGSLTIESSTISNNTSSGWAGGICHGNYGGPGPIVLENSTLTGNSAPGRAGALLIMICNQDNQVTNCTFEGNTSGSYGVLFNDRSTATYTNNTFVNNVCSGGGGGIYLYAGTMNMKNNLLANNAESGGTPNDFRYQSGTVNDNGNNLVEFSANYTFTGTGDITGDQPSLNISGALANNGTLNGTQTMALNTGSVAIDAGGTGSNGSVEVPCKDQRGLFNNSTKDIGAYEFNALSTVPYSIAIETDPVDDTACAGQNASFSVSSSNGLYYQWMKGGIDIPGATSATLTLNGVTIASAGEYSCRVSDDCVASNSGTATLSVYSTAGCVPPSSILHVDPSSFTGTISPSTDVFAGTFMNAITCNDVDVSFIGVELDAASAGGGVLKIGLYEGNTLVYETDPLSVTGGIDELVGEAVPAGTVTMNSSSAYKIGLIYSGPNYVYLKTSTAPTHLGIAEFVNVTSFYSNATVYPTLPDPWAIQGGWGFNIAFRIDGVPNTSNTTATISPVACDSYISPSGNYTWTTSGTYEDTIANAAGCDSLLTINLTINNSTSGSETVTACDSYVWSANGTTYNTTGVYTATLTNAVGCDSTATLNLTINNSTSGTDTQTACDSYTWIDGNTYTSSNNTATHVLTNAIGCDSIVTLDLTINNSTSGTDTQIACDSYTWIDGNTYTTSNNTATHVLTNAAGCDSTVTLDLTINNSTTGTDVQTACESFTWIDGNTYTSSNNTATHVLTSVAGCDSTVTLNLTINNSTTGTDTQTACGSFTWIDGNTYTSSNNTATYTLTNAAGCDSIVTLDLTIASGINTNVDLVVNSTNDLVLIASASNAQYKWLDCDDNFSEILIENNQTYMVTENGSYAVEITRNGCVDTSDCVNISSLGIEENSFAKQLTVYPNPTSGKVIIQNNYDTHEAIKVKLYSIYGQLIESKQLNNTNQIELMINESPGTYLLEVSNLKGQKSIIKIVKE